MKITLNLPDDFDELISNHSPNELSVILQSALLNKSSSIALEQMQSAQLERMSAKLDKILNTIEKQPFSVHDKTMDLESLNNQDASVIGTPDTSMLDFSKLQFSEEVERIEEDVATSLKGLKDFLKAGN